ncbi:MAG: hypothetical protein EXQ87_08600 [Alphaproteobacteria bacterium]|nr:hypothetical protein [Alphaproteobacteria bacterium]
MIHAYVQSNGRCRHIDIGSGDTLPADPLWLDSLDPSDAERAMVESALAVRLPSYAEMREIEQSSRFYVEDGARYMTANILAKADTPLPGTFPISFILARRALITLRQADPKPFRAYAVFLPPTLVASIYGMNFEIMPELKWVMGYPWALLLMFLSAVLPIVYFRRKGWF